MRSNTPLALNEDGDRIYGTVISLTRDIDFGTHVLSLETMVNSLKKHGFIYEVGNGFFFGPKLIDGNVCYIYKVDNTFHANNCKADELARVSLDAGFRLFPFTCSGLCKSEAKEHTEIYLKKLNEVFVDVEKSIQENRKGIKRFRKILC